MQPLSAALRTVVLTNTLRDTPHGAHACLTEELDLWYTELDLWGLPSNAWPQVPEHSHSCVPLSNFVGRTRHMATAPGNVRVCVSDAPGRKEAAPQARSPLQAACNPVQARLLLLCSIHRGITQIGAQEMSLERMSNTPMCRLAELLISLTAPTQCLFSAVHMILAFKPSRLFS